MENLGKIAYDAYRAFSNGKSLVSGADIPEWDDLPAPIRAAWCVAGTAVYGHVMNEPGKPWTEEQRAAYRKSMEARRP